MKFRLRPWPFSINEEVQLYWHGVPYVNSDGLWMLKCLFKRDDDSFNEQAFPFGTIPYLRIGQAYINGNIAEKSAIGSIYQVKVSHNTTFEICKGFDFPKSLYAFSKYPAPAYGNLPVCKFEADGIIYYIPCNEIVRGILAPNRMLANRILRPNGLDCFVESSNGYKNRLELRLTEEYHRDLLKDEVVSYFMWLLFNREARKSWDSVYKNIMLDTESNSDVTRELRKGVPIRVTPPVSGPSTWTFRGVEYKNHRLILELLCRSDLEIPFTYVDLYHPYIKSNVTDSRTRYVKDSTKKPLDNENVALDETGQGSEKSKNHSFIEQPPIVYSFKNKPRIFRKKQDTRKTHNGNLFVINTADSENKSDTVTTQDWVHGGNIPQIEFLTLMSVDPSLTKGLEDFLKVIDCLRAYQSELSLSLSIVTLPQNKSFSRYKDGNMRACAIVRVECKGQIPCYIIEVGRADNWSISTLIVKPDRFENAELSAFEGFCERLLSNLEDNNGHWDREFFQIQDKYIFDTAKHLTNQTIIRWAERIGEKVFLSK